jgi:hypothetical protein
MMEELLEILKQESASHPAMQPQDAVKLIYQNTFGGGHMITDSEASLALLKKECQEITADSSLPLFTPVGSHRVRFFLSPALAAYTPEQINDWFVRSSQMPSDCMTDYLARLRLVKRNFAACGFPFSEEEWDAYLAYYRGLAYPAVHHSPAYQAAYHPHYRVLWEGIWEY